MLHYRCVVPEPDIHSDKTVLEQATDGDCFFLTNTEDFLCLSSDVYNPDSMRQDCLGCGVECS